MTTLLILLAATHAAAVAEEPPSPTPTPPVAILLAKPEGGPPPQGGSLAEVAKRIKLKLPANGPRVLTNDSVKRLAEGVELTMSAAGPGGGAVVPAGAGGNEDAKRARWQQRYRAALQRVRGLESEVKILENRASELEREFYAHDDPVYRDSTIKPNWDRTLAALQKARSSLDEARKQPDEVLNAARRDGALPGWFRGLEDEATPIPPAAAPDQGAPAPRTKPTARPTPASPRLPVGPT